MMVNIVGGGGKDAIVATITNYHTDDAAAIGTVGSIPLLLPSTTTPIAAVDDHHRGCHTVDNDNRQKPVVVVCC